MFPKKIQVRERNILRSIFLLREKEDDSMEIQNIFGMGERERI